MFMVKYTKKKHRLLYNTQGKTLTNLITQHPDGAGSGNFTLSKPHRCQTRWDAQNKHGAHGAHKLAEKRHGKQVLPYAANLHPGTNAVEGGASQDHLSHPALVKHPHDGHNEWDIGEQVDHGEPVQGHCVDVVEAHEDVPNDTILEPHKCIAGRVGAKEEEHHPTAAVQACLHFGHQTNPVPGFHIQRRAQRATNKGAVACWTCGQQLLVDLGGENLPVVLGCTCCVLAHL